MSERPRTLLFRLPRSAYLTVLFLVIGVIPVAFAADIGDQGGPGGITWRVALLAIPVLVAVFIARTATLVGPAGVRVRALFGSRTFGWAQVRGLSITGRAVYLVLADGSVRLPCVRTSDLSAIAKVSDGHLPALPAPVRKFAPSRRPGRTRRSRRGRRASNP